MANKYKLREGVVLTTVCGETLLVSTRKVRNKCPRTLHLDEVAKCFLSLIESTADKQEIAAKISERFNVTEELALKNIDSFISTMEGYGVIVAEECE